MADERVKCTQPDCSNTILVATARSTGGMCRPCTQRMAAEKHHAHVLANRREVDPYAGLTDALDIATALLRPRNRDELTVERGFPGDVGDWFATLSAADIKRLIDLAISLAASGNLQDDYLARYLAAFTEADLAPLQRAHLAARRLYPGIIFRRAPWDVREGITARIAGGNVLTTSHALEALAWIGDDAAVRQFATWRSHPPAWAHDLHVAPHRYAHAAGWELADDKRRDLHLRAAFALVPSSDAESPSPVTVVSPAEGECHICNGPLTTLLAFDRSDAALSALDLPALVVTCALCTTVEPMFMKVAGDAAEWHPANRRREDAHDEPGEPWTPITRLVLGRQRNTLHAADQFLPTTMSQIGGAPGWIQDSAYPECPDCGRSMMFIAQVAPEDLEPYAEGLYYAFWCRECSVTATGYQQT